MRVLIDAHMVGERETGNETYIVNLIRGLQALETADEFLIATAHPDALARRVELGGRCRMVPVSASSVRRLLFDLDRVARREQADVMHVTYTAPLHTSCALVVTVHDVVYRRHPAWFSLRDLLVLELGVGATLRRADAVITVSEHARSDIATRYAFPAGRISVTYGAADTARFRPSEDPSRVDDVLARHGLARPYMLSVGNLQPRKNLRRLLEAFAIVKRRSGVPHRLALVGKAQWRASELYDLIRERGLERDVVFTGYVEEADLPVLYEAADLFAFPTLFEGFGLPVLEAMACGTPVISSRVASIPEVAGDAAVLVDPYSVGEIADAIEGVLTNRALAAELAREGPPRAACFSWRRTAERTLDVYRRAVRTRSPRRASEHRP